MKESNQNIEVLPITKKVIGKGNLILGRLQFKHDLLRAAESFLLFSAFGTICMAFTYFLFGHGIHLFVLQIFLFSLFLFYTWKRMDSNNSKEKMIAHLNEKHPQLEFSAALFDSSPEERSAMQELQYQRLERTIEAVKIDTKLAHRLLHLTLLLIVSVLASGIFLSSRLFIMDFFGTEQTEMVEMHQSNISNKKNDASTDKQFVFPEIVKKELSINPPSYTGIGKYLAQKDQAFFQEGSDITWQVALTKEAKELSLQFSDGTEISLEPKGNSNYLLSKTFNKSFYYQYKITALNGEMRLSDLFKMTLIKDELPEINISDQAAYSSIKIDQLKAHFIEAKLSDDYGIDSVLLATTISQGSGESVKFRDSIIHFNLNKSKFIDFKTNLDLKQMKLKPGDELYWQIAAKDNQRPKGKWKTSDTYIISIADTSLQAQLAGSAMPTDYMPAYFRSQRQIIIDTENLLKEKANISETEFKERSNSIGIDQKILRLRYGKFLGEEFESTAGGHAGHDNEHKKNKSQQVDENDHEGHDHEDHSGHDHESHEDHEGHDHEDHEDHDHEDHEGHDHAEAGHEGHNHAQSANPNDVDEEAQLLESYVHFHDTAEESTFFNRSITRRLKQALSHMWDAELKLRTFYPEAALPFENKALLIIKEIQQESRIYVAKMGVDLPKLKPENRLKGELDEILSSSKSGNIEVEPSFEYCRIAIEKVGRLKTNESDSIIINLALRAAFQKTSTELLSLLNEEAFPVFPIISQIQKVLDGTIGQSFASKEILEIRNNLSGLINAHDKRIFKGEKLTGKLGREYLKRLGM